MTLESTDALVVKTQKYRETSKIVTLYTRKLGKISVIAKGVRKTDSKLGGILEVINVVSTVFYYKPSRNIQLLKECDLIDPFIKIRDDIEKTSVAFAILELLNRTIVEEEPNERLFFLLTEIMKNLNEGDKNLMNFYWYFVLKILDILGFKINFQRCKGCGKNILPKEVYFIIEKGGVFCKGCSKRFDVDIDISPETFRILIKLQEISLSSVCNIMPSGRSAMEINEVLHRFMRYHIEDFKVPISLRMLYSLK